MSDTSDTMKACDFLLGIGERQAEARENEKAKLRAEMVAWRKENGQVAPKRPKRAINRKLSFAAKCKIVELRLAGKSYNSIAAAVGRSECACRLHWHKINRAGQLHRYTKGEAA